MEPVVNLLLLVGIGMVLGRIRIAGLPLGSVTGVLFVGLAFGHYGVPIPDASDNIGFILFIYSVGVQAGPQFLSAFRADGLRYFALSMVVAASALAVAGVAASTLGLEFGMVGGMLAGALTSTPTLVAAQDAVAQGIGIPPDLAASDVLGNISASYAITYVFGLAGLVLFIGFLPKILRVDLPAAAQELGKERGITSQTASISTLRSAQTPVIRAYEVESPEMIGRPLVPGTVPLAGEIQRVKRGSEVFAFEPDSVLEAGDVVAVIGPESVHRMARERVGREIVDYDVLDRSMETRRIIVSSRRATHRTLAEMDFVKNYQCWLTEITRAGMRVPRRPDLRIQVGDSLLVTGARSNLKALAERLGFVEQALQQSDLISMVFAIAVGVLIGSIKVQLGETLVGLGSAGGVLLMGLVVGVVHSHRPTIGRLPTAARYVLMELGLVGFMSGVAVSAGAEIVETFRVVGPSLAVSGVLVTLVPVLLSFLVGRYLFRMNPALLLGAVTGAMTSTAALTQVNSRAHSSVPTLGYVGTYTFANVLLTLAGSLAMRL